MKEIQLTRGYVAIVDDEDYERVAQHKWQANIFPRADGSLNVYAQRGVRKSDGCKSVQRLHRFILDAPAGMDIDHINGNSLDNRRSNLRVCTRSENMCNQRPRACGSSAFKGVSWFKRDAKWRAQIRIDGKTINLGCFTSEIDAARAYDAAATKNYGEFARTNGLAVV